MFIEKPEPVIFAEKLASGFEGAEANRGTLATPNIQHHSASFSQLSLSNSVEVAFLINISLPMRGENT